MEKTSGIQGRSIILLVGSRGIITVVREVALCHKEDHLSHLTTLYIVTRSKAVYTGSTGWVGGVATNDSVIGCRLYHRIECTSRSYINEAGISRIE